MEIICEECKAKLNIPDEKLPEGQQVSVRCPRCRKKLILDTTIERPGVSGAAVVESTESVRPGDGPRPAIEEGVELPQTEGTPGYSVEEDNVLNSYEEGVKLALVMNNDEQQTKKIKEALEGLGYRYVPGNNTEEAVGKMRFHRFDLIILSDYFDNVPLEESHILNYLNHLSMFVRRKMFVVLIGEGLRTMDDMMAFAMSANLVISLNDLDKLSIILKRAVSDNEKFYKVFFDTLREVGKA
jgi:predicted Zn finger-like uncharacterized protein